MSQAPNPFAPPKTSSFEPQSTPDGVDGIWRQDKLLIMRRDVFLPDRCLKCNAPASYRMKTTLQWHPQGYFLFVLINLIIYAIIAMIVRKTVKVELPLCPAHHQRRKIGIGVILGSFAVLIFGVAVGISLDVPVLAALSPLIFLVALIVGLVLIAVLTPTKIDDTYLRAKGAGPEFLASLPPFPGQ